MSKEDKRAPGSPDDDGVDAFMTPQQLAAIDAELAETESSSLGQRLTDYFAPPPNLNDRVNGRIANSLINRDTVLLAAELFTVGWRTTRVVVTPSDPDENPV